MAHLRLLAASAALALSAPARAADVERWRPLISQASARFAVPVSWIEEVMRAESGGRTEANGRPITSSAGAMGLMQLMPATWAEARGKLGLASNPYDPQDNILAGAYYLRELYRRFGYPGLFAAYNAGPGRYGAYLAGRPLPPETRSYVRVVADAAMPEPKPPSLFAIAPSSAKGSSGFNPSSARLFVALPIADKR